MPEHIVAVTAAGFMIDLIAGDPHWLWHPVQGIGWLIQTVEKWIRKICKKTPTGERAGGVFLVIIVLAVSLAVPAFLLCAAKTWIPRFFIILEIIFSWQILAVRSLRVESRKVYDALEHEGLEAGRRAVSMIVGRDTQNLTEEGVVRAAVETVAENTSDGVTAPMFYLMLFGPLGGFFYKAVNTMDSMVGYRNDRYRYLGTAAARLDDIVNYIPARISAGCMILGSWILGLNVRGAVRIFLRDRFCHKSPNSAQTEAVMAGALDIQLAGDAWYFGKRYEKPWIGDPVRAVKREDILTAGKLEYATAFLGYLLFGGVRILVTTVLLGG